MKAKGGTDASQHEGHCLLSSHTTEDRGICCLGLEVKRSNDVTTNGKSDICRDNQLHAGHWMCAIITLIQHITYIYSTHSFYLTS